MLFCQTWDFVSTGHIVTFAYCEMSDKTKGGTLPNLTKKSIVMNVDETWYNSQFIYGLSESEVGFFLCHCPVAEK